MNTRISHVKPSKLLGLLCGSMILLCGNAMAVNGAQLGGYGINNAMMGGHLYCLAA